MNDQQFIKILASKEVKEFQGKKYFDYKFKLVTDNEILKLKLLDRAEWFTKEDKNLDINF